MKKSMRAAAAAMLIPILLTLTGCSLTVDGVMSVIAPTETPVPGSDLVFSDAPEVTPEPRQIAYEKMDGVFSPFFAETALSARRGGQSRPCRDHPHDGDGRNGIRYDSS